MRILTALAVVLAAAPAAADVWTVDAAGGADFLAIQDAIYASADGDTVEVAPGTYAEALDFCGREIALIGTGGAEQTVLTPPYGVPAVTLMYGEGPDTLLSGFTITGADTHDTELEEGEDPPGAGVQIVYSCPTLSDLVIEGNTAYYGGGIKMKYNSHARVERVVVRDNLATGCGGGIYLCESNPTFIDVEVRDNVAEMMNGGGVIVGKGSSPRFHRVLVEGNSAGMDGGGLYVLGVEPGFPVDVLLSNTTISGNICDLLQMGAHGANVYLHLEVLTTWLNTIVANGFNGEGIYLYDYDPLSPDSLAVSYGVFWANSAGNVVSAEHGELIDAFAGLGVVQADPLFVEPGEDFHLQTVAGGYPEDSPALDAGYPAEAWNDPDGTRSDIGAYGGPRTVSHDSTGCTGTGSNDPCAGDDDTTGDDDDDSDDDTGAADDDSAGPPLKDCVCRSGGPGRAPHWLLLLTCLAALRRLSRS